MDWLIKTSSVRAGLSFRIFFFLLCLVLPLKSFGGAMICVRDFEELTPRPAVLTVQAQGADPDIVIHNEALRPYIEGGVTADNFDSLMVYLASKGYFHIPIDQNGYVVAASINHGTGTGDYSRAVWSRDLARVAEGASALARLRQRIPTLANYGLPTSGDVTKIRMALLKAMSTDETVDDQVARFAYNIQHPELYTKPDMADVNFLMWIRFASDTLRGVKNPDGKFQDWGLRQFDAFALSGKTLFNGLADGTLSFENLDYRYKRFLCLLVTFLDRIQFWKQADVGMWEKELSIHASSQAQVAGFMKFLAVGRSPEHVGQMRPEFQRFFADLDSFIKNDLPKYIDPVTLGFIQGAMLPTTLQWHETQTFDHVLNSRLGLNLDSHRPDFVQMTGERGPNNPDLALVSLFYDNDMYLKLSDQQLEGVYKILLTLLRPSGMIRHENDDFLNSADGFMNLEKWEPFVLADKNHIPDELKHQIEDAIRRKDVGALRAILGPGHEAEWGLGDSILSAHFFDRYVATRNEEFYKRGLFHMYRRLAQIPGEKGVSTSVIGLDGNPVPATAALEAWTPFHYRDEHGTVHLAYLASPNSPLNWQKAEDGKMFYSAHEALELHKALEHRVN